MSVPDLMMTDKVALITGGRRGLGKSFALMFAEAGADVVVVDNTDDGELTNVAGEIAKLGRRSLSIKVDITSKIDVENMVEKVINEFSNIDILINSAGVIIRDKFLQEREDSWDKVIDTNLKGSYLCSQAVSRIMIEHERGGCIINMASEAGFRAVPFKVGYSISKAGVIMLTQVLARELGSFNIRVNAIAPGVVKTPFNDDLLNTPDIVKTTLSNTPLGRLGEPIDIASAALFLASDNASWITGHTLIIDGGFLCNS